MFYRYVLRQKNAGKPGYAPFRVEHAAEASHSEIAGTLKELGMDVVFVGRVCVDTGARAQGQNSPALLAL